MMKKLHEREAWKAAYVDSLDEADFRVMTDHSHALDAVREGVLHGVCFPDDRDEELFYHEMLERITERRRQVVPEASYTHRLAFEQHALAGLQSELSAYVASHDDHPLVALAKIRSLVERIDVSRERVRSLELPARRERLAEEVGR